MTFLDMSKSGIKHSKLVVIKTWCLMLVGKILINTTSILRTPLLTNHLNTQPILMIEAGNIGWTSVFYTELYRSACDFIQPERVIRSKIDRSRSYLSQSLRNLVNNKPTHFCYDPRTGSQKLLPALFQTAILTIVLAFLRVTPVVILTDASVRQWRYQVFLLTAKSGVIITFLDPNKMGSLIPHKRILGPMFMPISIATLLEIDEKINSVRNSRGVQPSVFFLGSLYSKRVIFFEKLQSLLQANKSNVIIKTESKSNEIDPGLYWDKLVSVESVVTTTFQQEDPNYIQDLLEIDQLVFRISETLAAECVLFSSVAPSMEKFFIPGKDFIAYSDTEDAAEKIAFYAQNPSLAREIAKHGHETYRKLIEGRSFWKHVDIFLEKPLGIYKDINHV